MECEMTEIKKMLEIQNSNRESFKIIRTIKLEKFFCGYENVYNLKKSPISNNKNFRILELVQKYIYKFSNAFNCHLLFVLVFLLIISFLRKFI